MTESTSFLQQKSTLFYLLLGYWILYGLSRFMSLPFFVQAVLFFILITSSSLYFGVKGGLIAVVYYIFLVLIYQFFHPINLFGLIGGSSVGLLIALLIGLHRDQLKKKGDELGEREALYRELFENSLNGLALHKVVMEGERMVDFIYLQVNRIFLEQVGFDAEEILGRRGLEVFPQLDQEILDICGEVALRGGPVKTETYLAFLGGWYEISIFSHQRGYFTISLSDITERKSTEEALRKSRDGYESLVSTIPGVVYRAFYEKYRVIEYMSPVVKDLFGYEEDLFYGDESFYNSRIYFEDRRVVQELLTEAIERRERYFLQYRIVDATGRLHWVSDEGYVLIDNERDRFYLHGFLLDVTSKKEAMEALEKSEARFRSYVQNAGEIIFSIAPDGRFTYVSPRWTEELGHGVEEVEGKSITPFIHPEDLYTCLDAIHEIFSSDLRITGFEYRGLHKEGDYLWFSASANLVYDEETQSSYIVGIARNITEQKEAKEELKRQTTLLNSIFDNAPISIWVTDRDQEFLMVNQHFDEQTHISSSHPSITREELSICCKSDELALQKDEPIYCEETLTFTDGERHILSVIKTRLYDEEGEIQGVLGLGVDITERKRAEEALKKISSEQTLLLNTIETHVWYMQDESTYGKVNHSHAHFHGLRPEDMEDRKIIDVHGAHRGELYLEIVKMAFEKRRPIDVKDWFQDYLGKRRLLAMKMTPHQREGHVEYVVCSAEDITEQERERRLLADESEILSSIAQSFTALRSILERICRLVENQGEGLYCAILVLDEKTNTLSSYASPSLGHDFSSLFMNLEIHPQGPTCVQAVHRKDRVESSTIKEDEGFREYRDLLPTDLLACWSQPILSQDERVLGTVDVYSTDSKTPTVFTIGLMETASTLAGIAMERIESERKINEYTMAIELKNMELENLYSKMDEEVEKARDIHSHTLPTTYPSMEGLSIYAHYRPAAKMGGDFYNFKRMGDRLLFYLSDVTGHGLDGALMSIFVKNTIDNYLNLARESEILPSRIFEYLTSQYLKEGFPEDYFISILLGILDLSKGELIYSSAGLHVSPLVFTREGTIRELKAGNLPISSTIPIELLEYRDAIFHFPQGTTFFFTTDGLTEERKENMWYGDRFQSILRDYYYLPPEAIAQALNQDFSLFSGQLTGEDDITYLILQVHPSIDPPSFQRTIPSHYPTLMKTKEEIEDFLLEHLEEIDELMISLHELLINAMEHGNRGEEGQIHVKIMIEEQFIKMMVGDRGGGFNWRERLDQDAFELKEKVSERGRGLGLMFISLASDFFYYNPKGDWSTVIKIRKP